MGSAEPHAEPLAIKDIARRVAAAPPRLGSTRLVCIDGPAGSGKTSLAAGLQPELAAILGERVPVVHMDDLYEGWAHALDRVEQRLLAQVLQPLAEGRPGRHQRYDWNTGRFAEWHEVPPAAAIVIEGVGSAPRAAAPYISLLVWVEAPAGVRMARLVRRDGEELRAELEAWMTHESEFAEQHRTRRRADVVVDGAADDRPAGHVVVITDRKG